MFNLFKSLSQLVASIRTTLRRLEKSVGKDTKQVVYIAFTMLIIFETMLVSLLIVFIFLFSL